jgi:hypothetical protein
LLSITAIYYVLLPHKGYVILPLLPDADHTEGWLDGASPLIVHPAYITGKILQFYLNLKSQFFAGRHKMSVYLMLIEQGAVLAELSPSLVGRFDARPGLSAHEVVKLVIQLMAAWQAFTLPSVSQTDDDEHEE